MNELTNGGSVVPTPARPQRTEKPWGYEDLLVHGPYVLKRLHLDANKRLSLHYHERKIETLVVMSGTAEIAIAGNVRSYRCGEVVHVPAGVLHRLSAIDVDVFEASTPEVDDVVRIEDDYGRAVSASLGEVQVRE